MRSSQRRFNRWSWVSAKTQWTTEHPIDRDRQQQWVNKSIRSSPTCVMASRRGRRRRVTLFVYHVSSSSCGWRRSIRRGNSNNKTSTRELFSKRWLANLICLFVYWENCRQLSHHRLLLLLLLFQGMLWDRQAERSSSKSKTWSMDIITTARRAVAAVEVAQECQGSDGFKIT